LIIVTSDIIYTLANSGCSYFLPPEEAIKAFPACCPNDIFLRTFGLSGNSGLFKAGAFAGRHFEGNVRFFCSRLVGNIRSHGSIIIAILAQQQAERVDRLILFGIGVRSAQPQFSGA